jgi:hypothetical protein
MNDRIPEGAPPREGRRDPRLVHAPGRPLAAALPRAARRGGHVRDPARPASPRPRSPRCRSSTSRSTRACSTTTSRRPTSGRASTSRCARRRAPSWTGRSRRAADVDRLTPYDPRVAMDYIMDQIRYLVKRIDVPVLGFVGAPFTLASYLIAGPKTRNLDQAKAFMWREPEAWDRLSSFWAEHMAEFGVAQYEAGAAVVQVFDSWAGAPRRRTTSATCCPTWSASSSGCARPACRRSTSRPATPRCCRSSPRPAARRSASTGASRSTRRGRSSATTAACRATWTRR